MTTSVSPDVAYVLKHLGEVRGDNHKRKHELLVQYDDDESLDGENHLTQDETQSQPKVEVENIDEKTYRTLVRIFIFLFLNIYFLSNQIMVDPDAPSRDDAVKGPVLHWLVANFQQKDLKDGHTICN